MKISINTYATYPVDDDGFITIGNGDKVKASLFDGASAKGTIELNERKIEMLGVHFECVLDEKQRLLYITLVPNEKMEPSSNG
jgi:hypothetical protein